MSKEREKVRLPVMKVKDVMTTEIISVDKDVDLKYVMKLMKKNDITKIPILEEKKLVGVVTDNEIAKKLGAIRNRGVPAARLHASSVMEKDIEIVHADDTLRKILAKVGEPGPTMLMVMKDEELIGVVTKADLLPLVKSTKPVGEIMRSEIHSVSPDDRVIHARRRMIDENVARLPVINNGLLIGMISDIDIAFSLAKIKKLFPLGKQKHQLDELLVNDVMKTPVISAESDKTIKEIAELMMANQVGSIPITENKKIAGIVSRTDLLRTINLEE
jgi:CBS domain-containing protein